MTGLLHCGSCLSLHKCWFVFEKAPVSPLHEKCHCTTVAIPVSQVKNNAVAKSDYSKYNPYLFDPKNFYKHGKNKVFESWDTPFQIQNGCKKKSKSKESCSIFWEITNWVY